MTKLSPPARPPLLHFESQERRRIQQLVRRLDALKLRESTSAPNHFVSHEISALTWALERFDEVLTLRAENAALWVRVRELGGDE